MLQKESGVHRTICEMEDDNFIPYHGVFCKSGLEEIVLPSTVLRVNFRIFNMCDRLKAVFFDDDDHANGDIWTESTIPFLNVVQLRTSDFLLR